MSDGPSGCRCQSASYCLGTQYGETNRNGSKDRKNKVQVICHEHGSLAQGRKRCNARFRQYGNQGNRSHQKLLSLCELKNAFHSAAIPETLCWTMLSIIVMAWDTVIGMDWNFAFVSSAMLKREFFTTPAETIPFSRILFNGTFRPSHTLLNGPGDPRSRIQNGI